MKVIDIITSAAATPRTLMEDMIGQTVCVDHGDYVLEYVVVEVTSLLLKEIRILGEPMTDYFLRISGTKLEFDGIPCFITQNDLILPPELAFVR
jgi:hypothetical protein